MRMSIIKNGGVVVIDGEPMFGIDMSSLPPDFHALQWYGEHGNIEYFDPLVGQHSNENITDVSPYQSFISAWNEKKNVVENPSPATPNIPNSATPRQVRLLLLQQGLLANVNAMIAQQDEATKIAWEYASEFRRDDPLLVSLAQNLGLTSQQVDDFFIAAAAI